MWVLLAMAIGPQLLGHTGFTIALRYVPAYVIGAVILLEPVGATALGTIILNEWPTAQECLGAVVIVGGVMAATLKR
jgi:drug/metabolite transporter (DMT)-like permease